MSFPRYVRSGTLPNVSKSVPFSRLYIGTSGWSYPKGAGTWDGTFYPPKMKDPDKLTFYAQYFAYIDPTITFGPSVSIGALLPAIVGGAGTVLGPVLGSFVLTPLSELTRYALRGRAGADIMLYGAILVLVISFLPQGIVGLVRDRRARVSQR